MVFPISFRSLRPGRSRPKGAALVELAVVMPILVLMIFGCFEFLRFQFIVGIAKSASYEAARCLMVPGGLKQDGIDVANQKLAMVGVKGATVVIHAYGADGEQPEVNDETWAVTVQVQIPMNQNAFAMSQFTINQVVSSTTRLTSETYGGYFDNSVFE